MDIASEWKKLESTQRIVVKVGTSTLTHKTGNLNLVRMELLVRQLVDLKNQGREVILVTSAAVGAGMGRLNIQERPKEMSAKQALAAIGQGILMHIYEKYFGEFGIAVAQVLLTKDDVAHRQRYLNARNTLRQINEYGAVPIINENDTVAYDQIKVGDNDTLAAMVAGLVDADLLVLLSDIDGLYTSDPRKDTTAKLIPVVEESTPEIEALAGGEGSKLASGGMVTKIAAARIAVTQGIPMVLTNGSRRNCLQFLNDGLAEGKPDNHANGTLFIPKAHFLGSRKGWLAFSTRTAGVIRVDEGASEALLKNGKSLLASGIRQVEGDFSRGEVVEIRCEASIIARGIVNYSAKELERIKGRHSSEIEGILGPGHDQEAVHRDNLSIWR
ncbi:MAG: glutamate 5-kinase [Peptococcaceae bacterium]|jgi:glutamate 5-kinase|nr:glutamate 5-kinase [Peptococcaceae bacterium]